MSSGWTQGLYKQIDNEPLLEVLKKIETQDRIKFSYNDETISPYFISIEKGVYTLPEILSLVFVQTRLSYEILDDLHVLISQNEQKLNELFSFCGYLIDKQSNLPIPYGTVRTKDFRVGIVTDSSGYFSVMLRSQDKQLEASYLGYETLNFESNVFDSDCKKYYMHIKVNKLETIILREYLGDGITQSRDAIAVVIHPPKMRLLPGSVDNDVLAAIQFLPGITSPMESLDGIHIRGGTPDQNLILWDDIPVYHSGHLLGMISAYNPFIVESVNVYRSSISSEYGGRVSGVIALKSKERVPSHFKAGLGLNLTHGHLELETPLWKNAGLYISTQRSITDIWNTPTFLRYAEKVFQGTKIDIDNFNNNESLSDKFRFNDGTIKWLWNVGNNKFRASLLGGLNNLNYTNQLEQWNAFSIDVLDLTNAGAILSWEKNWSKQFSSKLQFTNAEFVSDYNLSISLITNPDEAAYSLHSNNKISDEGIKLSFLWLPDTYQKIKFGYQQTSNFTSLTFKHKELTKLREENNQISNDLHALFGEYAMVLENILELNMGLRLQRQTQFKRAYFEPRIAVSAYLNRHTRLKVSTSKLFQFVSQLVILGVNDLDISNKIWVSSSPNFIPVIESNQWMGGFIFQKGNWTLDMEGYVKEIGGITSLSSGFSELHEQAFSYGSSKIRGVDILVKKRFDNWNSWLSYTLSEALYEFPNLSIEEFPATHDQRHVLQWINMYKTSKWEYSLGLNLKSGLPTTIARNAELIENMEGDLIPNLNYGAINGDRLKHYFRMDASIVRRFGKKEGFGGYISISLQNLTNQTNILGREYFLETASQGVIPNIISIDNKGLKMTPNVMLNLRF